MKNSSYEYRGEAHAYDNKQYLRARYYDVHSENFIQEDTYRGTQDDVGSRNRYNYAQNNPYKYSDPSGHLVVNDGSGAFKFVNVASWTATLLNVNKFKAMQAGCTEVLLLNNKLFTGKYNGASYVDGIKQASTSSGSRESSGSRTITETNSNHYIQDDIIVATFTPTKISVSAPMLDTSKLTEAAQAKVRDTAKALNIPEEILRQFLLADLDNSRSRLERGYSLSDRVIGLCDAYLNAIGKRNDTDSGKVSIVDNETNETNSNSKTTLGTDEYLIEIEAYYRECLRFGTLNGYELSYGGKEAFNKIKEDMEAYINIYGSTNNISDVNWRKLCYKINEFVSDFYAVWEEAHYFRNKLNRAPATLDKMIELNRNLSSDKKWKLMDIDGSAYHMYGDEGEYNLKFVSYDGIFEAVYNKKGELLTEHNDPKNMGTYNYVSSDDWIGHGIYDVIPYMLFGNTPEDNYERLSEIANRDKAINNAEVQAYRDEVYNKIYK